MRGRAVLTAPAPDARVIGDAHYGEGGGMPELPTAIIDALRSVYDPCCQERGISVVDMGLVRSVDVDGDRARVELVLTTGWCPFTTHLLTAVRERVESLPEVEGAAVEVVWDEPWTTDRLSADARRKLRFLPDPSAVSDRDGFVSDARARNRMDTSPAPVGHAVEEAGQ
jgi:metal-sulfur cluster biosynthetic enzyme